jgi:Flp pilus assembly pilin Flp
MPAPPPRIQRHDTQHARAVTLLRRLRADEGGSAAVEYVGLGVVVSMLMAAGATAVDSALGERLARAIVERLIDAVTQLGT